MSFAVLVSGSTTGGEKGNVKNETEKQKKYTREMEQRVKQNAAGEAAKCFWRFPCKKNPRVLVTRDARAVVSVTRKILCPLTDIIRDV